MSATRRQVLQSGAAIAASLGMLKVHAAEAPAMRGLIAVVDPHFSASAAFMRESVGAGVQLQALTGDVGDVWLALMDRCAGANPPTLIGLTAEQSLFCLDLMTRSHGLRLVHRVDHAAALDAAGGRDAAQRALASLRAPLKALPLSRGPAMSAQTREQAVLNSWVIAPRPRVV